MLDAESSNGHRLLESKTLTRTLPAASQDHRLLESRRLPANRLHVALPRRGVMALAGSRAGRSAGSPLRLVLDHRQGLKV